MNIKNLIQTIFGKLTSSASLTLIAKQLRQPSGKFGQRVGTEMNKSNAFLYDFILENMGITPSQTILEIGFGNGKFFDKVFSKANNLKVYGIDFSKTMVKAAILNNEEALKNGSLTLQYGNCEVLPYGDNTFDAVFCCNVVYFWENPSKNLKEIFRVLKPGSRFNAGIRNKESMLLMPFTKYGFTMYEEAEWKSLVEQNGFHYIDGLKTQEPPFEVNGHTYQFGSLCLIAQKN